MGYTHSDRARHSRAFFEIAGNYDCEKMIKHLSIRMYVLCIACVHRIRYPLSAYKAQPVLCLAVHALHMLVHISQSAPLFSKIPMFSPFSLFPSSRCSRCSRSCPCRCPCHLASLHFRFLLSRPFLPCTPAVLPRYCTAGSLLDPHSGSHKRSQSNDLFGNKHRRPWTIK